MSLLSDYELISNLEFKGRVAMAILKAARDILVEDDETEHHDARLLWAESIVSLSEAHYQAGLFLPNIVANSTISSSGEASTDNDIQFVVNSLVNQYALEQYPNT